MQETGKPGLREAELLAVGSVLVGGHCLRRKPRPNDGGGARLLYQELAEDKRIADFQSLIC